MDKRITNAFWVLRISLGLTAFLAGLDKFFNLLTDWEQYLNPLATRLTGLSPALFMRIAGVIEMVAGIALLAGLTRLAAYVVTAWLTAIALNLLSTGHYFDVAVRDLVMAAGAWSLARLAEVREASTGKSAAASSRSLKATTA
jgi:uncharacterized membrane protein YphA (DoxX/SURF4 family)